MTRRPVRSVEISIEDPKWKKLSSPARARVKRIALRALEWEKAKGSLTILLSGDARLKELNALFRGKNKPTNVLSFPQFKMVGLKARDLDSFPDQDALPLGDVVLAHSTIKKECKEQDKTLENHVIHLVVHGTLHLLGYDHMKPAEAKKMEKLECDILQSLGYPDPYHEQDLVKPEPQPKRRRR